jgi:hypothetical protein
MSGFLNRIQEPFQMFNQFVSFADRLIAAVEKTATAIQKMADRVDAAKLPEAVPYGITPKDDEIPTPDGKVYLCICGRVNREPACKCGKKEIADFLVFATLPEATAHLAANPPTSSVKAPTTEKKKAKTPKPTTADTTVVDVVPVSPTTTVHAPAAATETAVTNVPDMDTIRAGISKVMALRGKEVGRKIVVEVGNSQTVSLISAENLPAVWAAIQKELEV